MKKAKIMLTAITVLALVGGALAFKAEKFSVNYCTTNAAILPVNGVCPNFNSQYKQAGVSKFYYTIALPTRTDCKDAGGVNNLQCGAISTFIVKE